MVTIHFLDKFLAGKNCFGSVYDNNIIAAVSVRGKVNFMFAAKKSRSGNGSASEGFAGSIKNVPFTLDGSSLGHSGGHGVYLLIFLVFFFLSKATSVIIVKQTAPVNSFLKEI